LGGGLARGRRFLFVRAVRANLGFAWFFLAFVGFRAPEKPRKAKPGPDKSQARPWLFFAFRAAAIGLWTAHP
jgi:hypothetical protein